MADATEPIAEAEPAGRTASPGEVIAAKSADVHKKSSNRHVKVFVLARPEAHRG
jgi:hypothetical protein